MVNNLRRIRESKGMTLEFVGEKVLVSKAALSKIENGQQNLLAELAVKLADLYDVSADHLLGREWIDKNKEVIIKEAELTYEKIFKSLGRFDNKQLYSIVGACEFLIETRGNGMNPQTAQNKMDKYSK
jgi:transcriptional regulator with XRE-family HTH domain